MAEKIQFDTSEANNTHEITKDPTLATPSNVKQNYIFKDVTTHEPLVGSMTINPSQRIKINPQQDNSYTIPEGYHDGFGIVYTGDLDEYTYGTATSNDIRKNKIAWVNGQKVIGTLDVDDSDQIGTATASDIIDGKTAWVNHNKITGTIPLLPRHDQLLMAGESYTFPAGLSAGTTIISSASIQDQTLGSATKFDIISDKTAWVNGQKIVGVLDIDEEISKKLSGTDAERKHVLYGKKFFSAQEGQIKSGTMENHSDLGLIELQPGQIYTITEGYYNGLSQVKAKSLHDSTIGSALAKDITKDKTAWVNGEKVTGTMPFNNISIKELEPDEIYNIPEGYHPGSEQIKTKSLKDLTDATAESGDIVNGKTAWVKGQKITGSIVNYYNSSHELSVGETYFLPDGFYNGASNLWVKPLSYYTQASSTSEDILKNKTAWVNGSKITGSIDLIEDTEIVLEPGNSYNIIKGYHSGNSIVKAKKIEDITPATAKPDDIVKGETAWVNGEKIIGTLNLSGNALAGDVLKNKSFYNTDPKNAIVGTLELTGDAIEENVFKGQTFYSNNPKRKLVGTMELTGNAIPENVLFGSTYYSTDHKQKEYGTMPNNAPSSITLSAEEEYTIPLGYHSGIGVVKAASLAEQTMGTASAVDIIKSKTAWVNGQKVTGSLELTGNANKWHVLSGSTFYSDSPYDKQSGLMTNNSDWSATELLAGAYAQIPEGYHNGNGKITTVSLRDQTNATATINDLLENTTAWVNGQKITGTILVHALEKLRLGAGSHVFLPAGYYPNGIDIYSLYGEDILDLTGTDAEVIVNDLFPNSSGHIEQQSLIITDVPV